MRWPGPGEWSAAGSRRGVADRRIGGHTGDFMGGEKRLGQLGEPTRMEEMQKAGAEYRMLIMPDHPTPIRCRTHTSDPVPYMLYDSTSSVMHKKAHENEVKNVRKYNEADVKLSGNVVKEGYTIIDKLFER